MGDLIGGPLMAACDAQVRLATATANFIKVVGFNPPADPSKADANAVGDVRTVSFKFNRPSTAVATDPNTAPSMETVELEVPLLAVVKIPSLAINTVDITFNMEVKNSETTTEKSASEAKGELEAKFGWGPVSGSVKISGSVSSSKETQRQTDSSAKYTVIVKAEDKGMPEGLARVLDMMNQSIAPKTITPPKT
ncbi:DUF2589 domain-containing protein [Aerophototrophica crusticola]|uniref:DUF2589 domain-containing protein n=2 Tax=Aerophototrophica crusticola TaxID=1709002 RepID=A0A858RBP6_9PROT|nr:DUF2589 domain-containing protein [Rhodospirillaceae bacterium B3]